MKQKNIYDMLVVVKTAITQLNLSKSAFIPLPHHHIKACEMQKKSVSIIICGYNLCQQIWQYGHALVYFKYAIPSWISHS